MEGVRVWSHPHGSGAVLTFTGCSSGMQSIYLFWFFSSPPSSVEFDGRDSNKSPSISKFFLLFSFQPAASKLVLSELLPLSHTKVAVCHLAWETPRERHLGKNWLVEWNAYPADETRNAYPADETILWQGVENVCQVGTLNEGQSERWVFFYH